MPEPRGVRSRWLDRSRGQPLAHRRAVAGLLHTEDGRLHFAGRAGTGMTEKELKRLAGLLGPLKVPRMPLAEPPPRDSRFGSPLKLSRSLGAAANGSRSHLPDLDRGQPLASGVVPGAARGQAGHTGRAGNCTSAENALTGPAVGLERLFRLVIIYPERCRCARKPE